MKPFEDGINSNGSKAGSEFSGIITDTNRLLAVPSG